MKDYKLIIFDADGTLVTTASGAKFRNQASDWKWLDGRKEKLHELRSQGVRLAVATNQGGVAFGYMTQVDILRELTRMCIEGHIPMGGLYVCYNHPTATALGYKQIDERRKPGPGMLLEAMNDFNVNQFYTLMVGDRSEDEQAAKNARCDFMWASEFF